MDKDYQYQKDANTKGTLLLSYAHTILQSLKAVPTVVLQMLLSQLCNDGHA